MSDKAEKKPEAAAPADKAAAPADKAAAAAHAADGHGAPADGAKKKGGIGAMLTKTPVMLGGVMILEAVVLFAGFKFLGSGANNAAGANVVTHEESEEHAEGGHEGGEEHAEGGHDDGHGGGAPKSSGKKEASTEVQVLDFKAQNKLSGRTFLYDVSVYAVVKTEFAERVTAKVKAREALIKDRVRTIIAQNDPEKLGGGSEPGLETLRRQVKHQLDEIIGEGMIQEVLVPRCIPFRTDF
jgi:flagellar basal body-associated protein FliL